MWKKQDTQNRVRSPETAVPESSSTLEECPFCHSSVQCGRFCASCGARLPSNQGGGEDYLQTEMGSSNFQTSQDEGWYDINSGTSISGFFDSAQGNNKFKGNMRTSYTGRRSSVDNSEDEYLVNQNSNRLDSLQSTIQVSPSHSTLSNGLLSYGNNPFQGRRRASTSNALGFGPTSLGDEHLIADYSYDNDVFETSQEPYGYPARVGSVSLDPIDSFNSNHAMRSSIDSSQYNITSLRHNNSVVASLVPFDNSHTFTSGLDFPGDLMDDTPFQPSTTTSHYRTNRSFSDVDMTSLPDLTDLSSQGVLATGIGSRSSSQLLRSQTLGGTFGNDVMIPKLMKRISLSSLSGSSNIDETPFLQNPVTPPHSSSDHVVKGSINFPSVRTSPPRSVIPDVVIPHAAASEVVVAPSVSKKEQVEKTSGSLGALDGMTLDIAETKKIAEYRGFKGHIVELVCTQNGSKNIQNFLNSSMTEQVRNSVIDEIDIEIQHNGCHILCDTFGNYFIQLLFEKASASQKEFLLKALLQNSTTCKSGSTIYEISVNKTGTFAFQNIIDFMTGNRVLGELIVGSLKNAQLSGDRCEDVTLKLIKENRGTHIIQRIMKKFDIDQWESIYRILLDNCFSVAMDRNGSMVLRLCFDLVDIVKKGRIASVIIEHARELATDPVGNYVVQHVLTLPDEVISTSDMEVFYTYIKSMLNKLAGHYVELSKQKYSSNVVEKSIANSILLNDNGIFCELTQIPAIVQLLENHFGSFVLQKTMQSMSKNDLKKVDEEVRNSRSFSGSHGVILLNKWKIKISTVM